MVGDSAVAHPGSLDGATPDRGSCGRALPHARDGLRGAGLQDAAAVWLRAPSVAQECALVLDARAATMSRRSVLGAWLEGTSTWRRAVWNGVYGEVYRRAGRAAARPARRAPRSSLLPPNTALVDSLSASAGREVGRRFRPEARVGAPPSRGPPSLGWWPDNAANTQCVRRRPS